MNPEYVEDEEMDEQTELFYKSLSNAVAYVSNEALVLTQYEVARPGLFPKLWDGIGDFDKRMNDIAEHLGGPPDFYIMSKTREVEPPPADSYPDATLREALEMFLRARKSVVRAHMFMTGSTVLAHAPEMMDLSTETDEAELFVSSAQSAFWEHAETAYIRLYSFWDRIGQILEFAFFNIRKFDHNTFSAVIDRINANIVPMSKRLESSASWKRVRTFQKSEKEDGLKWLLARRNLIVHSLHLHPIKTKDESVFKSQFNHLENSHREKLRPRDAGGEVDLLLGQLNQAASLFGSVLSIIQTTPSRKVDPFIS
ncbi:TPA: hypothetical protein ACGCF2_000195 [Stenotrophomonas maltophilia]